MIYSNRQQCIIATYNSNGTCSLPHVSVVGVAKTLGSHRGPRDSVSLFLYYFAQCVGYCSNDTQGCTNGMASLPDPSGPVW